MIQRYMIQRYSFMHHFMSPTASGEYVLYTDHLAEMDDQISKLTIERNEAIKEICKWAQRAGKLTSLVHGATKIVEKFNTDSISETEWKKYWLKRANEALKEASHE